MRYESTRGRAGSVESAEAVRRGLAPDGGLYLPEAMPAFGPGEVEGFAGRPYAEVAATVLGLYLSDYSRAELDGIAAAAYSPQRFDTPEVAPLRDYDESAWLLELWHGPTAAFKDMALQVLPRLSVAAMRAGGSGRELVILVATSGDTGKAALEGFRDLAGTRVIVFYPEFGVSEMQRLQMATQEGANVHAIGVEGGDFDVAQAGVKAIFSDEAFAARLASRGFELSSANSINWGRLVPQIAYYATSYAELLRRGAISPGERVDVVVPTGNFGNILAAYYARRMGVPLGRLVCASNANRVLTDFFESGEYDRRRPLRKTASPSMDILVSSNLERLLYELAGRDPARLRLWMSSLAAEGAYRVGDEVRKAAADVFWAGSCDEAGTTAAIARAWKERGILVDPHTAVALDVLEQYRRATGDGAKTIVASTASPYKFNAAVAAAVLGAGRAKGGDEFELLGLLEAETGIEAPAALRGLRGKPALHRRSCAPAAMRDTVASILGA